MDFLGVCTYVLNLAHISSIFSCLGADVDSGSGSAAGSELESVIQLIMMVAEPPVLSYSPSISVDKR